MKTRSLTLSLSLALVLLSACYMQIPPGYTLTPVNKPVQAQSLPVTPKPTATQPPQSSKPKSYYGMSTKAPTAGEEAADALGEYNNFSSEPASKPTEGPVDQEARDAAKAADQKASDALKFSMTIYKAMKAAQAGQVGGGLPDKGASYGIVETSIGSAPDSCAGAANQLEVVNYVGLKLTAVIDDKYTATAWVHKNGKMYVCLPGKAKGHTLVLVALNPQETEVSHESITYNIDDYPSAFGGRSISAMPSQFHEK